MIRLICGQNTERASQLSRLQDIRMLCLLAMKISGRFRRFLLRLLMACFMVVVRRI